MLFIAAFHLLSSLLTPGHGNLLRGDWYVRGTGAYGVFFVISHETNS